MGLGRSLRLDAGVDGPGRQQDGSADKGNHDFNHDVGGRDADETCAFAPPLQASKRAKAIVKAATHYQDPKVLLEVSEDLTGAMKGLAVSALDEAHMLQTRGW